MKVLDFRVRMHAWKDITVKVKNEKLFKEKYKKFCNDEFDGDNFHYSFLDYDYFKDCVELEDSGVQWDDEDFEEMDELLGDYIYN
jgi:hypothetical protein